MAGASCGRGSVLQVFGDCGERPHRTRGLVGHRNDVVGNGWERGRRGESGDWPDRLATADPEPVQPARHHAASAS